MVCQKALLRQIHNACILSVEGVMGMDLIDRHEAIEAVCSVVMGMSDYPLTYAYEVAEEALENLPSASPDLSEEDMRLIKKLRSFHNGSYAVVLDKLITSACNKTKQQAIVSSDLISRQDICDWLNEMEKYGRKEDAHGYHNTCAYIAQLPSAQPEIVRCKDCKWGREVCGNIECFVDSNFPPEYHGYEWFCPNGER